MRQHEPEIGFLDTEDDLARSLWADPFLDKYDKWANKAPGNSDRDPRPITSAAVALGEQRFNALSMYYPHGIEWLAVHESRRQHFPPAVLARLIYAAEGYVWSTSSHRMALEMEMPPHRFDLRSTIPHALWWSFERSLSGPTLETEAWLLIPDDQGLHCVGFGWIPNAPLAASPQSEDQRAVEYVQPLADGARVGERTHFVGILKMLALMNSHYVPKRREIAEASRKSVTNPKKKEVVGGPSVTFIDLRRIAQRKPQQGDEAADGDYQCRWLVRGHLRKQWYAKTRTHRVIYVPPYIKGPEDKPFRESVGHVIR